jgi:CRISPR system CASCADE complex protein CasB/Cse2
LTTPTSTTTAPEAASAQRPTRQVVIDVVGEYVAELQKGYRNNTSTAVALLAQLRRGAGKLPHDVPELWGITGIERIHQQQALSEAEASRAETALFIAVTLYALHQQSRSEQDMHRRGVDLGAATRRLMLAVGDGIDEPIRRRFVRIGTATTVDTLAFRLREMVSLLRRESIPLDYAQLAGHLYEAQFPGGLAQVRARWGRSFHAYRPPAAKSKVPAGTGPSLTDTGDKTTTTEDTE